MNLWFVGIILALFLRVWPSFFCFALFLVKTIPYGDNANDHVVKELYSSGNSAGLLTILGFLSSPLVIHRRYS